MDTVTNFLDVRLRESHGVSGPVGQYQEGQNIMPELAQSVSCHGASKDKHIPAAKQVKKTRGKLGAQLKQIGMETMSEGIWAIVVVAAQTVQRSLSEGIG